MTREEPQPVTIRNEERVLAGADVAPVAKQDSLHASLYVEAGQLPPGTRTQLVDAVLDLPAVTPGTHLHATVPAGDAEMLDQVRKRCTDVETRQAGATFLVEGTVEG